MTRRKTTLTLILTTATLCAAAVQGEERAMTPATVVMGFPATLGAMERPTVEFDHAAHTTALSSDGCETCHSIDERGLTPQLTGTVDATGRDDLTNAYHDTCMGCHKRRSAASSKSGPVTCGECHVRRAPGVSERIDMAFDYSLHARHSQAYPEKCETCHHVYDEAQQKLIYKKGTEEACRSCHGAADVENTPSVTNASHRDCIGCHLDRAKNQLDGGPVLCVGCHEASRREAIDTLEEVPRLVRGQPDTMWITAVDATTKTVPFDHKAHEGLTSSCSTCHHRTLKACKECHTLTGTEEGAGVTMAQAYHLSSSEQSCIGCHGANTVQKDCSGCHQAFGRAAADRACTVCHSGPQPGPEPLETPPPVTERPVLTLLPPTDDDFPETVVIESLVDTYEPSKLPHAKIVAKLDAGVRESSLAGRFHGATETLCAGCHHHSPVGSRPPPCRACHGGTAETTIDKPGLKVAYHRQCVGCHIEMGLEKQGCTDCHTARVEVES